MLRFKSIDKLPKNNLGNPIFIVKCPDWNEEGYQICSFDFSSKEFFYSGQLNDNFMSCITEWALFLSDRVGD